MVHGRMEYERIAWISIGFRSGRSISLGMREALMSYSFFKNASYYDTMTSSTTRTIEYLI
jgi:hypothetical protein